MVERKIEKSRNRNRGEERESISETSASLQILIVKSKNSRKNEMLYLMPIHFTYSFEVHIFERSMLNFRHILSSISMFGELLLG